MKRNLWPYAIIVYFVVFITGIASWIVFAVHNDHQLVGKDYYEREIKFQSEIDSSTRGAGSGVVVKYDSTQSKVTVSIPSNPREGSVQFYRPSDSRLDRQLPLSLSMGSQVIDLRAFEKGLWKVRLCWTADGSEYRHEETLVL
jgi:hypothetical protein